MLVKAKTKFFDISAANPKKAFVPPSRWNKNVAGSSWNNAPGETYSTKIGSKNSWTPYILSKPYSLKQWKELTNVLLSLDRTILDSSWDKSLCMQSSWRTFGDNWQFEDHSWIAHGNCKSGIQVRSESRLEAVKAGWNEAFAWADRVWT